MQPLRLCGEPRHEGSLAPRRPVDVVRALRVLNVDSISLTRSFLRL